MFIKYTAEAFENPFAVIGGICVLLIIIQSIAWFFEGTQYIKDKISPQEPEPLKKDPPEMVDAAQVIMGNMTRDEWITKYAHVLPVTQFDKVLAVIDNCLKAEEEQKASNNRYGYKF